jgi:hypothetical protein
MESITDYLGDAVYARYDGVCIGLSLNHHRNEPLIWLEPEVMAALNRFAERAAQVRLDQHARPAIGPVATDHDLANLWQRSRTAGYGWRSIYELGRRHGAAGVATSQEDYE